MWFQVQGKEDAKKQAGFMVRTVSLNAFASLNRLIINLWCYLNSSVCCDQCNVEFTEATYALMWIFYSLKYSTK